MNNRPAANYSQELAIFAVAICFGAVALYVAVAAPTLVWSVLHGEPTLVSFGDAIGGGIRWIATGADGDPRRLPAFRAYRDVMPPPDTWTAMNVGLLIILVLAVGRGAGAIGPLARLAGGRPAAVAPAQLGRVSLVTLAPAAVLAKMLASRGWRREAEGRNPETAPMQLMRTGLAPSSPLSGDGPRTRWSRAQLRSAVFVDPRR